VAMGNATDDVKPHADYVTTSVDEEGIAHALYELRIIYPALSSPRCNRLCSIYPFRLRPAR
jgi:hypothetical protein